MRQTKEMETRKVGGLVEELTTIVLTYMDPENQPSQWPLSELPRLVREAVERCTGQTEVGRLSIAIEPTDLIDVQDAIAWGNWCEAQCEKGATTFIALL